MAEPELVGKDQKVVHTLIKAHGAMPFLELTSVSDIDEAELEQIVARLEKQRLVRVLNSEDIFEKVVGLTDLGYKLAQFRT